MQTFTKILSANDVGTTGAHQGGFLIPKSEAELLEFLPPLNATVKNPDAWLECKDESGLDLRLRFVYYNNKLHDPKGTRNEYRITYMTRYFKSVGAKAGDTLEISGDSSKKFYTIRVVAAASTIPEIQEVAMRVKITSWQRKH